MESYMLEFVKRSLTTPPNDNEATIKSWKVRAAKAMYVIKTSVEKEVL